MKFLCFGYMNKKHPSEAGSRLGVTFFIHVTTPRQDSFLIQYAGINPFLIFWKLALNMFFRKKKMAETIKLQSTGEKLEFTWKNEMVDDFISSLEHFNALM